MNLRRCLVGSGLLLAVSVAGMTLAVAAPRTPSVGAPAVFRVVRLLPGDKVTGAVTVPGAQVPVLPYLQAGNVRSSCATCGAGPPPIADVLTLSATAPAGQTWTGTLTRLVRRITLPGGAIPIGDDRTYTLVLALPARAGNAYQDVTISAMLTWGGTDASGVTRSVLSEHATRSAATASDDSTLALTGPDILGLLGIATALLGFGAACLSAARAARRFQTGASSAPHPPG